MAFLLLLHEKMRLKRNINKMTLRQSRLANRKARIADRITKINKMYSSKLTSLDKQSSIWAKNFQNSLMTSWGLGAQNQMFHPMGGLGITSFVANMMGGMLANCPGIANGKNADGQITYKDISGGMDSSIYQKMLQDYMTDGLRENVDDDKKGTGKYGAGSWTKDQRDVFMQALSAAQSQQQQAQWSAQQMSQMYTDNVSIWVEAQKAQIEQEQEEALLPLELEQTDIELENEGLETQLQDARARLESIQQACSEGIKDSAPKFGLG